MTLPVWWKTSLDWRVLFPRNFWAWAILLQKSVTWNSDSPLGVKGQYHGSGQSSSFPSTRIARAHHCTPQSPHLRLVCTLPSDLTIPQKQKLECFFYHLLCVCKQDGLLCVWILPFPKLLWSCAAAPCPALWQRFFPFRNERLLQEMEAAQQSPAEVTAAVAERVPCRIMWVILSGICTFPLNTQQGEGKWWWGTSSCNV